MFIMKLIVYGDELICEELASTWQHCDLNKNDC